MVGEGVLHECLNHPDVEQVLIINRKPAESITSQIKRNCTSGFF